MEPSLCHSCLKAQSSFRCGVCQCELCKKCTKFVQENEFSFMPKISQDLTHSIYCGQCYDQIVAPALEAYAKDMERAKNIFIFSKAQSKETRLMKRSTPPYQVKDCPDREETILRLAFLAAKDNFNAIIDVDVVADKICKGKYQTSNWRGTAIPAQVNPVKEWI
jgi:hypothetical protein